MVLLVFLQASRVHLRFMAQVVVLVEVGVETSLAPEQIHKEEPEMELELRLMD
jgi:hypothetical protein